MLEDFEKKIQINHDIIANGKKITIYIYLRNWSYFLIAQIYYRDRFDKTTQYLFCHFLFDFELFE